MAPRADAAQGCDIEPYDGSVEQALSFGSSQKAANVAQRFALPATQAGSEWYLDDICVVVTRAGSPGTSEFTFVVFRDQGGLPGDPITFSTVQAPLPAAPAATLCLEDFSYSLLGFDAIHVGIAWNPEEENVFLGMDTNPATPAQVVSARTSALGPQGLGGWSPVSATQPTFRAAAVGITLFSSTPAWVTTELASPSGAASGFDGDGGAPAAIRVDQPLAPRLDIGTARLIGGIAREVHSGADLLGVTVFQDAAQNRAFFSLLAPTADPAAGRFEKITKLLDGVRFVGDELLDWPDDPDQFTFALVDQPRNLLLGIFDVPAPGTPDLLDIDWHMTDQPPPPQMAVRAGVAKVAAAGKDVCLAIATTGFNVVMACRNQLTDDFDDVQTLGAGNLVSGSSGGLGPVLVNVPVMGVESPCLLYTQVTAQGTPPPTQVRSVCGYPWDGASNPLFDDALLPFARRADTIVYDVNQALEELEAASLPPQMDRPHDVLLFWQGDGQIHVTCLDYNVAAGRLDFAGQDAIGSTQAGRSVTWTVGNGGSPYDQRVIAGYPTPNGTAWNRIVRRVENTVCDYETVYSGAIPGIESDGFVSSWSAHPGVDGHAFAGVSGRGLPDSTKSGWSLLGQLLPGPASVARAVVAGPALVHLERRTPRPCARGETVHCLQGDRFEVAADWRTQGGLRGTARAFDLTDDSGLFYFFAPDNLELIAKVIDACGSAFQSHWVFTAGLTDVEYVLEVFDGETGRRRHYVNRLKSAAAPVQDTSAFKPCPAALLAAEDRAESWHLPDWARDALASRRDGEAGARLISSPALPLLDAAATASAAPRAAPRAGVCVPGPTTLCLQDGRFRVEAEWMTKSSSSGDGQAIPLTADTGAFWFFDSQNVEILVKVIDACASAFDSFWVFAAGLTNVEVVLTVTDTVTDAVKIYENPLDQAFQPVQDTRAFMTCQ